MFRKLAITAGVGLALSVPAHAQQYIGKVYKWEVNGSASTGEYSADRADDTEFDSFDVSGT